MVPFVSQQLNNLELALALAKRGNLPGAEPLIAQQFEKLFSSGLYKEAAEAAADSPQVRGDTTKRCYGITRKKWFTSRCRISMRISLLYFI